MIVKIKNYFRERKLNFSALMFFIFCTFISLGNLSTNSFKLQKEVHSFWYYNDSFKGYIFDDLILSLDKGQYDVKLFFDPTSISDDISYKVVDFNSVGTGDENGEIIHEGVIKANEDSVFFQLSLDHPSVNIGFVFEEEFTFYKYLVKSSGVTYLDSLVSLVGIVILSFLMMMSLKYKRYDLITLVLLAIFISFPMLGKELNYAHDLPFHLTRIIGIANGLREGIFPVRINMEFTFGFGHACGFYYPDLFLYIPALFSLLGCSITYSYKLFIVIINVVTACVAYYSFISLFSDKKVSLLISILWLLNPYRLNCIYIRGALGEVLAMAFIPLFVYGLIELLSLNYKNILPFIIGSLGILYSHIVTVLVAIFFSIIYFIFNFKNFIHSDFKCRVKSCCLTLLILFFLSMWFSVPLMNMMQINVGINQDFGIESTALQLWQPFMSSANYSLLGYNSSFKELPQNIGLVYLVIIVFVLALTHSISNSSQKNVVTSCFLSSLVILIVCTDLFPWDFLSANFSVIYKMLNKMQFIWRFLGIISVFFLISFGYCLIKSKSKFIYTISFILAVIPAVNILDTYVNSSPRYIYGSSQICKPMYNVDYYEQFFLSLDPQELKKLANKITSTDSDLEINSFKRIGSNFYVQMNINKNKRYSFPLYNYGFYHLYINDEEIDVYQNEYGMLEFESNMNIENANIKVVYETRKLYLVSNLVSIITVVSLCIICSKKRKSC